MSDEPAADVDAPADPYRELFERSADAILIIEGDRFVDCNQAAVAMLRCHDREQVLRTHPSQLSPEHQPDGRDSFTKANEMIALAFERGSHRFEWAHRRADGEVFPVEVLLTAVRRGGQQILHVVWRDITERRRLEESLRHGQKMEAVGRLAGGIAHDFNNLLVTILGNAELLAQRLADRPSERHFIEDIQTAGERAGLLVRQLLAFAENREIEPKVFDLTSALAQVERLLRRIVGEDVELAVVLGPHALPVLAGPGEVEQALVNLVTNARDALPRGGKVTIEVGPTALVRASLPDAPDLPDGTYGLVRVRDTGVGMDEETRRRAFDPFFTTKEPGKGTGLGLASVYAVMRRCRGAARIESAPGHGTTVELYFPLATGEVERPPQATEAAPVGGGEAVLVAEDEPAVARLIVRVLTGGGYRVLLAADGVEALSTFRAHRDEIALVLTDVVMPNLGGVELVRALRADGYGGPTLFTSGYTDHALERARDLGPDVELLEKPFTPAFLLDRVRRVLATV